MFDSRTHENFPFRSLLNNVVGDIGSAVLDFFQIIDEDDERSLIGKEISVDPMLEWENRRSNLKKKQRSSKGSMINFDRGFPVMKVKRKRRSQVAMVDTIRLQPVETVSRIARQHSSLSIYSNRSSTSVVPITVRRGLK
uniref:Uncharacterized protein n=1 Tax=Chaetoceros debilis TaxID=122233 RepID=A0A7S3Q6G3_9STRA|mmetsp:Transcript_9795/g.14697  ORF Transcript_9795/g.14697 Transcript_9795/m.14697 type:complete len:139 (+) Transcript_9795:191-607(+)